MSDTTERKIAVGVPTVPDQTVIQELTETVYDVYTTHSPVVTDTAHTLVVRVAPAPSLLILHVQETVELIHFPQEARKSENIEACAKTCKPGTDILDRCCSGWRE